MCNQSKAPGVNFNDPSCSSQYVSQLFHTDGWMQINYRLHLSSSQEQHSILLISYHCGQMAEDEFLKFKDDFWRRVV